MLHLIIFFLLIIECIIFSLVCIFLICKVTSDKCEVFLLLHEYLDYFLVSYFAQNPTAVKHDGLYRQMSNKNQNTPVPTLPTPIVKWCLHHIL